MEALMKLLSGIIVICVYLCECKGGQFKSYESFRTNDGSNLVEYLAFDKQSPIRCSVQCINKPDCEAFAMKHDSCKLLKKSEAGETFIPGNDEHLYTFNPDSKYAKTTYAVDSTFSTVPSTTSVNTVTSTTLTDTTTQTTTVGTTPTESATLPPVPAAKAGEQFPYVITAGEIWGTNYIMFATEKLFYVIDTVKLTITYESQYSMNKFPQFTGSSVTAAIKIEDLLYLQDENANWKIYSVVITDGSFISATLISSEITNPDVTGLVNLAAWIGSGAVFLRYDDNDEYKCMDKAYFTCKVEECAGVQQGDWFECEYIVNKFKENENGVSAATVTLGHETDSQMLSLVFGKTLIEYSVPQ